MKVIKKLEELIEEEIHDSTKYAKLAAEYKHEHPALAQVLFNISTQEEAHMNMLHTEVVKLIEAHRKTHGDPPEAMMAVYDYVHKRNIEKMGEARNYQDVYRNL